MIRAARRSDVDALAELDVALPWLANRFETVQCVRYSANLNGHLGYVWGAMFAD